jgi:uncharacterized iron-regulated membrane protein
MSKLALRRAWFQVHKWIGLILAILIIPLSLTGSALVWDEALDHGLNPQRYAVSGGTVIDPARYVAAARAALKPEDAIVSIALPGGDGPVIVTASSPGKSISGPPRTMVYLDPPTARVLDVADNRSGVLRVFHMIHGSLMLPGPGRAIVGWIGVAMMISCFTGLWLWWPTVGSWLRGFRWRRHNNLDTNLHHLMGFWIALPLFILSLTGAWIAFPQFFGALTGGAPQRGGGMDRAAMARAKPLAVTQLSLDDAIAKGRAKVPGDVRQITFPTDLKAEWKVTLAGDPQPSVTVDDDTGKAKAGRIMPEDTSRLMRRIHDGTRMGLLWQIILFVTGIIPAVLAVTGIIMWWRARRWKSELKARRATI